MDEFDVFMDLGTRERAIEQILAFAEANKSKQFILITPQVCPAIISYMPGYHCSAVAMVSFFGAGFCGLHEGV